MAAAAAVIVVGEVMPYPTTYVLLLTLSKVALKEEEYPAAKVAIARKVHTAPAHTNTKCHCSRSCSSANEMEEGRVKETNRGKGVRHNERRRHT